MLSLFTIFFVMRSKFSIFPIIFVTSHRITNVFFIIAMNISISTKVATFILLCLPLCTWGQNALTRSLRQIEYNIETQGSFANGDTPLWLNANHYGLSSIKGNNGYLRAAISHNVNADSLNKWRIGYGLDLAAPINYTSHFIIQQLYADFEYKKIRLTIGAKQQPMLLKNTSLSSGSQTLGINARPIPCVRFEIPEYLNISGRGDWAAIRGHISYGMQTDGNFEADYVGTNTSAHYAKNVLVHTKAGYLRLGNKQKFPLTFEGGIEMATQFGGTAYNVVTWDGINTSPLKMTHKLKDFINATFGLGGDVTDGQGYANATGNTLGSWLARLSWQERNWALSVYYDHFFEDHSQMFLQYGWLDGLVGVEARLPHNHIVDNVLYEFVKTTYQSGPVYHDHTTAIPDQISGTDNYYNHSIYTGWQHWGQAIGNPLFTSPLYNHKADLFFTSNRFKAHHVGISGSPCNGLHYRLFYTHQRSLGTYSIPYDMARTNNSYMFEVGFSPLRIGKINTKGWGLKTTFAFDRGDLLGNNTGFQLTISKVGLLKR